MVGGKACQEYCQQKFDQGGPAEEHIRSVFASQASRASTCLHSEVFIMWTVLGLQQVMLRLSLGTFGRSSTDFSEWDWIRQWKNGTLGTNIYRIFIALFHQKKFHLKLTKVQSSHSILVPRIRKSFTAIFRILIFNFSPENAEKLFLFLWTTKAERLFKLSSKIKETLDSVNKSLSNDSELAFKQPPPKKQLLVMKDSSFRNTGNALMTNDNRELKFQCRNRNQTTARISTILFCVPNSKCQYTWMSTWLYTWRFSISLIFCGTQQIVERALPDNSFLVRNKQNKSVSTRETITVQSLKTYTGCENHVKTLTTRCWGHQ